MCRRCLQLVSRRFPAGSSQVTAFVASPGAAAGLEGCIAAAELRERYRQAAVSLLITVLCPPEELGSAAAGALEALAGNGTSSSSSDEAASGCSSDEEGEGCEAVGKPSRSRIRLVWLTPVESAAESWQQLEPALEQLESSSSMAAAAAAASAAAVDVSSSSGRSALPPLISRAPRQYDALRHPRTPLLATRSGIRQPALCRCVAARLA
jgi:hypothetical protein